MKCRFQRGVSLIAMTAALGLWGAKAMAADAAASEAASGESEVSAVVVTGSYIAGTPEDAALPVNVISSEDLQKQGSPSTLELIKGLSVSNGVLGDTNQFDARAQGSEGTGTINLRGLGPARTLVLLNGRRLTVSPRVIGVDTNVLPVAAIGRVEVLKDGAAATYGSDAIAGVVNFITRKNLHGIELGGTYSYIQGSDGDYTLSAVGGWQNEDVDLLFSAGYQRRSELRVIDRDWAHRPFLDNPEGGWSAAGNPGTFIPLGAPTTRFRDPSCSGLGNFGGFSGLTPVCFWQFTQFDNLVEDEKHYQLFGSANVRLSEHHNFHAEALYAKTDLPHWRTSPSYAFLQTPTAQDGAVAGQYFVPANNPGLQVFITANPGGVPGVTTTGAGVNISAASLASGALLVAARPFGVGGNPLFGFDSSRGQRRYEAVRLSSGFNGDLTDSIGYDVAVTYSVERSFQSGRDTLVERFQRALRGLGGPDCPLTGGTPGGGPCMFYNPFGNAIPGNAITGAANPAFNAAVGNDNRALIDWFFPFIHNTTESKLFVVDAVLNGKLGVSLPGGDIGWAFGGQYRKDWYTLSLDDLSNLAVSPCIDSPDFHDNSCLNTPSGATSPFVFLGGALPIDVTGDVWAGFGELSLPFTDTLQVQAAARYEDYGGAVGSTFNPQVRAKWQATPWLAFRGSVGSTFRAPPATQIDPQSITTLQSIGGVFRAVRIFGNPDLKPEKANTFNVGAIVEAGGFTATVDYWNFDFKNPIVTEPVSGIVATMFPTATGHCGDPAFAALQARFTFNGTCLLTNVVRLDTNVINGARVKTDGVDFSADYVFEDVFDGRLKIGGDATWVHKYTTDALTVEGQLVQSAFDGVGFLNYQTTAYPLPQWKGSAFVEYTHGPHNFRATVRYVDSYTDQRTAPFAPGAYNNNSCGGTVPVGTGTCGVIGTLGVNGGDFIQNSNGKKIDAFATLDLAYRVFLPWGTTLTAAAINVFDTDPPFARLDLNYDPFTASALGRVLKIGVQKKF